MQPASGPVISPAVAEPYRAYYPALTGLRAVAAYMVMFFHAGPRMLVAPSGAALWFGRFVETWSAGVTVFFVLSGFLIATRYGGTQQFSWPWWRGYFQNRFARIYPVYFLLTALTLLCLWLPPTYSHLWGDVKWKSKLIYLLLNLSLLRGYFVQAFTVGIMPAWSLTVEETFYVLAPLLLLGLRHRWWWLLACPVVLAGLGVACVPLVAGVPYGFLGNVRYMLMFTFFGRSLEFVLGIGLALFCQRVRTTTRSLFTVAGGLGFGVGLLGLAYLTETAGDTSFAYLAYYRYLLPVPVALLLLGLVRENTQLARALSTPMAQYLGRISYALYLVHLNPMAQLFGRYVSDNLWVKVAASTLAAVVLYEWVERPLHERLKTKELQVKIGVVGPGEAANKPQQMLAGDAA